MSLPKCLIDNKAHPQSWIEGEGISPLLLYWSEYISRKATRKARSLYTEIVKLKVHNFSCAQEYEEDCQADIGCDFREER